MDINLHSLLPDDISDETAYQLVNFFVELTSALESHYFAQMKRYIDGKTPTPHLNQSS